MVLLCERENSLGFEVLRNKVRVVLEERSMIFEALISMCVENTSFWKGNLGSYLLFEAMMYGKNITYLHLEMYPSCGILGGVSVFETVRGIFVPVEIDMLKVNLSVSIYKNYTEGYLLFRHSKPNCKGVESTSFHLHTCMFRAQRTSLVRLSTISGLYL